MILSRRHRECNLPGYGKRDELHRGNQASTMPARPDLSRGTQKGRPTLCLSRTSDLNGGQALAFLRHQRAARGEGRLRQPPGDETQTERRPPTSYTGKQPRPTAASHKPVGDRHTPKCGSQSGRAAPASPTTKQPRLTATPHKPARDHQPGTTGPPTAQRQTTARNPASCLSTVWRERGSSRDQDAERRQQRQAQKVCERKPCTCRSGRDFSFVTSFILGQEVHTALLCILQFLHRGMP